MSTIGRRFLAMHGLLVGLVSFLILAMLLVQWLLPGVLGELPRWLPEDVLAGLGFQFVADLIYWWPALAFSSVVLSFSFLLDPKKSGKKRTGSHSIVCAGHRCHHHFCGAGTLGRAMGLPRGSTIWNSGYRD